MKEIIAEKDRIKYIGFQVENMRAVVRFHLADMLAEYPNGEFSLVVRRPDGTEGTIAGMTEMDGTDLVWTVESRFLEATGTLRAQVVCVVDDVVAKEEQYKFKVRKGVVLPGEITPSEISFYVDDFGDLIYTVTGHVDVDFEIDDSTGDMYTNYSNGYSINQYGDMIQRQ